MTLVAAGFLAGLLCLAVPWWLHRRDYRSATPAMVSSLLLMREAEEPQAERKVLRYRWLLAARLLLLILLVLAFAQPVLDRLAPPALGSGEPARLVAVDVSASMAAAWSDAQERAAELLRGDAALVAVGATLELRLPLGASGAEQAAALAMLEPTAARLSFEGLVARLAALADTLAGPGEVLEIHLVSDFQASAAPGRFNSLVEGASHPVVLHRVDGTRSNYFIESFDAEGMTVAGSSTAPTELELKVWLDEEELHTARVELEASGRAQVPLPALPTGRHDQRLRAELYASDALTLDNVAYHVRPAPRERAVTVLGEDAGARRYAEAALAASGQFQMLETLGDAALAVLVDMPERSEDMAAYLRDGGAALIVGGARSRRAGRVPALGSLAATARVAQRPSYVAVQDAAHPALRRFADWRDVVVFEALLPQAESAAGEVLLTLDDGAPLLLEQAVGRGRALILLTGLDPEWATLPAAPAFVAFVEDALAYLGQDLLPTKVIAGDSFALPARNVQIIDADGKRQLSLEQSLGRGAVRLDEPGHFQLRAAAGGEGPRRYLAVNVARQESDLTPLSAASFSRWRDAVAASGATRPAAAAAPAAEGLELAPWLLLLVLLVLGLEPLLANGRWRGVTA